jgi:hypothetical protein
MLFAVGCGSTTTSSDSTASSPEGVQASTGTNGLQTLEGNGFTLEAPASWTKLPADSGVAVSSPSDFAKGKAGVPVSVAIFPVQAPLTPATMVTSLLENNRAIGDVESETQIKVAGRDATKLVHTLTSRINTTSDDVSVSRMIRVFVPLDAGVLAVQVQGADASVKLTMPQIDAIVDSIKLK